MSDAAKPPARAPMLSVREALDFMLSAARALHDTEIVPTLAANGRVLAAAQVSAINVPAADNTQMDGYAVRAEDCASGSATLKVSQRIPAGMTMMYHAQEKIINVPGAEMTGKRGGIHNSVTRAVPKPTHMIGGYAQLAYGFNYYGTVGSNRDEFVLVRKMNKVDWLEGPLQEEGA